MGGDLFRHACAVTDYVTDREDLWKKKKTKTNSWSIVLLSLLYSLSLLMN